MAFPKDLRACDKSSLDKSSAPAQSRSFTTNGSGSTADHRKSTTTSNSLNTGVGNGGTSWASSIWGNGGMTNGFSSRVTTRDNSASRAGAEQSGTRADESEEPKKGSGALVDSSSVLDISNNRTTWGKRSYGNGTFGAKPKQNDAPHSGQRSVSSAGLPSPFSLNSQNFSSFPSMPQPINLTTTNSSSRPAFYSSFSGSAASRGIEQPPNVYTKHDRPADPNARQVPDSAKEGAWSGPSPIDDRKHSFANPFGKNISQPPSRDGSTPSSGFCMGSFPYTGTDYSRSSTQPTPSSSRTQSISLRSDSSFSIPFDTRGDQITLQFGQMSLNSGIFPRPFDHSGTVNGWTRTSRPVFDTSRSCRNDEVTDASEEADDYSVNPTTISALGGSTIRNASQTFGGLGAPTALNGRIEDLPTFEPGRPFATGIFAPPSYQQQAASRFSLSSQQPDSTPRQLYQRSSSFQDQALVSGQPRADSQMSNLYGTSMNPYMIPTQLPQMASVWSPMALSPIGMDQMANVDCAASSEGVQSQLMYEFRNQPKSRRYELKDIYGHIPEFSGDQYGSRFIQTKLETANSDEKNHVFAEIEPNAYQLMTDVFGNYVIQKFFEHGDQTHKRILANKMKGQVFKLSQSMYGCRVVQKALDHLYVDQQVELIKELEFPNHVVECVTNQNGNHVIQKAIERCEPNMIQFIFNSFIGRVESLSIHSYGCRVIQRCLEKCRGETKRMIMSELMNGIPSMIQDQFGNYVVQHVVEHDDGEAKRRVMQTVIGNLETHSKHKFASNVVEKCLEKADDEWRCKVAWTITSDNTRRGDGDSLFVSLIKDSYGNYVIQKLLDVLPESQTSYHFHDALAFALLQARRCGNAKQISSIERKMQRFSPSPYHHHRAPPSHQHHHHENGSSGMFVHPHPRPAFGAFMHNQLSPLGQPQRVFGNSAFGSAANTPPPLTADQSTQSSRMTSMNGDAVEGAIAVGMARTGSGSSQEEGVGRFRG